MFPYSNLYFSMILDCPSCDLGLNPSQPTRIIGKCSDGECPSQDKMLWKLFELRDEYGLPKLDKIFCSGFDQPFSLKNGESIHVLLGSVNMYVTCICTIHPYTANWAILKKETSSIAVEFTSRFSRF